MLGGRRRRRCRRIPRHDRARARVSICSYRLSRRSRRHHFTRRHAMTSRELAFICPPPHSRAARQSHRRIHDESSRQSEHKPGRRHKRRQRLIERLKRVGRLEANKKHLQKAAANEKVIEQNNDLLPSFASAFSFLCSTSAAASRLQLKFVARGKMASRAVQRD